MSVLNIIGLSLSIIGLILDVSGFIGIYFKAILPLNNINSVIITRYSGGDLKSNITTLENQLNKSISNFNTTLSNNKEKSKPFFRLIVLGFIFQIFGIVFSLNIFSL